MHVLVNPDHHITGDEWVTARVEGIVGNAVDRFADRITRVEVHLNDVNGPKHGLREKRCMMEARVGGVKPIAVKHQAPTLLEAIDAHCRTRLARFKQPRRTIVVTGLPHSATGKVAKGRLRALARSETLGLDAS
jgi:acyl-CoA synthetase (AMP-forming)/AMP-acid ligase II